MKTEEKLSKEIIKRIVFIAIILILLMGAGVFANKSKVNNVTIVFSDNTELSVITSKTKVSDILKENNIVLLDNEEVIPSLDSNINQNKKIQIGLKKSEIEESDESVIVSSDIINESATIVEKIVVEQVKIPFETVKKEVSVKKGEKKTNKVVQKGKNGIKEITYKVKYENNIEIQRTKVSEKVIKKPVNKIIRVTKKVTSRSGDRESSSVISYGNGKYSYSSAEFDLLCAITAQECSSSYKGALAVITTACNRAESRQWKSKGRDPLSQYKAKGQFCYSIDSHWIKRLNGNYPGCVKKAVLDALNGTRNHQYLSFRSRSSGHSGTPIGGNVYFNKMK